MKALILAILISLSAGMTASGQDNYGPGNTRPLNSINLNFLGDASIISLHFERLFPVNPSWLISGKLGVGYNEEFQLCLFGSCGPKRSYVTLPHHITAVYGKNRHFVETGLGGTYLFGDTEQNYFVYPIIGYRFMSRGPDKIIFRIFVQVPFSGLDTEDIVFVPVGVSIGMAL